MELVTTAEAWVGQETDQPTTDTARQRLERIFSDCCDGLYRFILVRVGGDRHAADELLQETCRIAAGPSALPSDDGGVEAWLGGIARNLIRKHWRDLKRERTLRLKDVERCRQLAEDMSTRPIPPEILARRETMDLLLHAVTTLPAADQRMVFAFYFEGRSQSDIAAQAGLTVKALESKLYRIRGGLRETLGNLCEDER